MALAALGVSALGTGLGSLLGSSLGGKPEYGFKDTAKTETVRQLDPKQLQQILDDLTNAEQTGRGDITGNVERALGFITGDNEVVQRRQAISETAKALAEQNKRQFTQQHIVPKIEQQKQAALDSITRMANFNQNERNQYMLANSSYSLWKNKPTSAITYAANKAFAWADTKDENGLTSRHKEAIKKYDGQMYNAATYPDSVNLEQYIQPNNNDNKALLEQYKSFSPDNAAMIKAADQQLRQANPELFANENATGVVDPYLQQQQQLNLSALGQMASFSGLTNPAGPEIMSQEQFMQQQEQEALQRAQQANQAALQQGQQAFAQSGGQRVLQNPNMGGSQMQALAQQQALQQQMLQQAMSGEGVQPGQQAQQFQQQMMQQQPQQSMAQQGNVQGQPPITYEQYVQQQKDNYRDPRLVALENTPGYKWRFDQGQQAVARSGAARGLLDSGAIMKGLTEFGQGMAAQEFQAEHQRLASLAGLTSNASLTGASQAQANRFAGADLLANQGTGLAGISTGMAINRANNIQQGGTVTQDQTQSQLFNLANMSPVVK